MICFYPQTSLFKKYCLKGIIILVGLFSTAVSSSQIINDTLNRVDNANKRAGYWVLYFDKDFRFCKAGEARYFCYTYYGNNGKQIAKPIGKQGKNITIVYKPSANASGGQPTLLDGEIFYYFDDSKTRQLSNYENYNKGRLAVYKEFYTSRIFDTPETITVYFDSLYKNDPNKFLYERVDNNIKLYKEYVNVKPRERTYFVSYKERSYKNRILIGYHGIVGNGLAEGIKPKEFAEIGYSKKYIRSLYIDTTGRYYDRNNFAYGAINFSLLGSNTNNRFCLGQKATLSYVLLVYRIEAGILNYTDFKKSDPRLAFGAGISIFHVVNVMINYSLPLIKNQFNDISRGNLSIFIN